MNNPLLSVIVPFYNRADYLKKNIESLLSQIYPNFELILIDDGSTDNSSKITERYKDNRIRLLRKDHQGCWKSKNEGIRQAKGDYLVFIDSDDWISEDYLLKGIFGIQLNPGHDYYYPLKLTICNEKGVPSDSVWKYLNINEQSPQLIIKLFFDQCLGAVPHAGAFIKRTLFDKIGLYEDHHTNMADTVYVVKNALKINFFCLPDLQYYYNRQHALQTNKINLPRHQTIAECLWYLTEHFTSDLLTEQPNLSASDLNQIYMARFMAEAERNPEVKEIYLTYAMQFLKKIREDEK